MCQYRAVGHPIAVAVTEALVDSGARALGMDPAEVRRRNLIPDDAYPHTNAWGMKFERLSHQAALARLLEMMDYEALRAEQARLREEGVFRGIGLAAFVEVTNPSAAFYGVGGARISAQDGCTARLDASGALVIQISVTEQGQGTEAAMAQVAASAFGVPIERVRVISGDTDNTPYGGGTWASRAAGIGGEATLQAAVALRRNVLDVAGKLLQASPEGLDIQDGAVVDAGDGRERMPLEELARIAYFRPDTLPEGVRPELIATRHFVPRAYPFAFTNGIQGSYLEVDVETGFVTLLEALGGRGLRHGDQPAAGRRADPRRRGAGDRRRAVRGVHLRCGGQLRNGNMADYLVPMAREMPDNRGRPRHEPDRGIGARREGRRRGGHRRRAGRDHERDQRRARPHGRRRHRAARDAGADPARSRQGGLGLHATGRAPAAKGGKEHEPEATSRSRR